VENKTVVITGSTKGIGKGYAYEFLKRGYQVVVSARSSEQLEKTLSNLTDRLNCASRVAGLECDVSDALQIEKLWNLAKDKFGSVDIWINNAGFARTNVSFLQLNPEEIKTMVSSNLVGTVNGCQVALRGMKQQGFGHIYNTYGAGSDGRVIPGMIGYATTKSSVRYFTESLIKELKDTNVKVGMISPGVNISENFLAQMMQIDESRRKFAIKMANLFGDYVETTTPWIVEKIINDNSMGTHIKWMTVRKLMGRKFRSFFINRDLFSRYNIN